MQPKQMTSIHRALIGLLAGMLFAEMLFAAGETIPRSAVTGGGGAVSAGNVALRAAIGQPAAGAVGDAPTLCSGIICGPGVSASPPMPGPSPSEKLFLPIVKR